MTVPDILEQLENSAENWALDNMRNGKFRCPGCGEWRPESDMNPSSINPYAPPICGACKQKDFNKCP